MCAIYITSVLSGNVTEMLRCNIFPSLQVGKIEVSLIWLSIYIYLFSVWAYGCFVFFNVHYVLLAISEFYHFGGCTSYVLICMFFEHENHGERRLQDRFLEMEPEQF